jgi:hypothetical protein
VSLARAQNLSKAKTFGGTNPFADRQIHNNHQSQSSIFWPPSALRAADLLGRLYRRFKEDGLMRRFVLLTCVGLALVSFPGCAKWKKKHFYHSAYEGDACGCGGYTAGVPVGAPAAIDTVVSGPGSVISAPAKGPMPAPQL